MKKYIKLTVLTGIGLLVFSTFVLSQQKHYTENEDLSESALGNSREEIYKIIGEAPCINVDECAIVGFGSKPCGGSKDFLIYSTRNTDVELLKQKVNEYNKVERQYNIKHRIVSDCMMEPPPSVRCFKGKCVSGLKD